MWKRALFINNVKDWYLLIGREGIGGWTVVSSIVVSEGHQRSMNIV